MSSYEENIIKCVNINMFYANVSFHNDEPNTFVVYVLYKFIMNIWPTTGESLIVFERVF